MWNHVLILFGSADKTLLCSSGWPETLGPPASVSQGLGLWAWGTIIGSITSSWCSASVHIPCRLRSVWRYWKKYSYPCGQKSNVLKHSFLELCTKDPSRPPTPRFLMRDTQMRTLACLRLGACFPALHHTGTAYLRKLTLWLEDASPAVLVFMMSYKHASALHTIESFWVEARITAEVAASSWQRLLHKWVGKMHSALVPMETCDPLGLVFYSLVQLLKECLWPAQK